MKRKFLEIEKSLRKATVDVQNIKGLLNKKYSSNVHVWLFLWKINFMVTVFSCRFSISVGNEFHTQEVHWEVRMIRWLDSGFQMSNQIFSIMHIHEAALVNVDAQHFPFKIRKPLDEAFYGEVIIRVTIFLRLYLHFSALLFCQHWLEAGILQWGSPFSTLARKFCHLLFLGKSCLQELSDKFFFLIVVW